jgi:hypothetical protein
VDAPSLLVVVLGLVSMAGLALGALGWQRAALERAGRLRAERTVAAHRGSIVRLAEVARAGWREDGAFTARGTVKVRRD